VAFAVNIEVLQGGAVKNKSLIRSAVALAVVLGVGAPSTARADGSGESGGQAALVGKLTEEGMTLYGAHDYRRAVEKFMAAYAIDPDPNLLFNTARCYEQLGDVRAAIDKYEAFLAEPGGDANGRRKAQDALASLRKSTGAPAADASRSPAAARAEPPKSAAHGGGPPWSTVAWISLGVGVAAGAAGTVAYLSGKSDEDQLTGTPGYGQAARLQVANITMANAQDLVDRSNTKKLVGEVLWGVGAAGLAGAVVFFIVGRGSSEAQPAVGFAPAPGGGALSVRGSF